MLAVIISICLISILTIKLCVHKKSYDSEDEEQKKENLVIQNPS
jgi:hypothetical protein